MSHQPQSIYEFGSYRLDAAERLLLREGEAVPLQPKVFDLLHVLVERHGHLLEKDELMKLVWPDAIVEEANLANNISILRKTLSENGERFIETVPKRGYRFVAPVRVQAADQDVVGDAAVAVAHGATEQPEAASSALSMWGITRWVRRRPGLAALLLILLAVGLAGAINSWLKRRQPGASIAAIKTIAVLPFKPLSADSRDESLELGMADTLITKLGGLRQIIVRPTSAVRKYGALEQDPVAAGRELRVEAVIEGSVQRVGEQIRVTVQLVSVRDGAPLWAEKFDEQFTNIFAVQDRISEQVARALTLPLSSAEKELLTKRYTENSETYQLYLKGRYFWNKRTVEGLKKGIGYFNEAVEKDPSYALAYVGLADSYSLLSDYQALPPKEVYPQAKQAATKALELDERLAEAHAALAFIKAAYDWDWPGAEREYRRAIELNPNYETAHQWYAEYLSGMGRHEEAIAEITRAREINPISLIINAVEVWVLYYAREYDQAIAQGQKVVEMDPHFAEVYEFLKRCYDQKGMYREAIAARQMRRKLAGFDAEETTALREAAAATSARVYWRKRLEQEMEEAKRELNTAFELAEIYAQLGEKDQAFAWLERTYEERYFTMIYLKVAPNLDPLRSDARFADLLRRVGLPP